MLRLFAFLFALGIGVAHAQVTPGTSPLSGAKGGTNNSFMQFTGPASSIKTYTLPNASDTLATLGQIQTWTGAQSFSDGKLVLLGLSSGSSTLKAPATGGGTATLFAGSDTVMGLATAQSPTNKTIAGSTNVLGGVTMTLGSDATGDVYYRNSSGILTRLGIGSPGNVLTVSGGLPAWVTAAGGGNVSNTGTPVANQIAQWTNATTIQGISIVAPAQGGTGVASPTAHTIPINEGSSAQNNSGTGTFGQMLSSTGASSDPAWASGQWTYLGTTTISGGAISNGGIISTANAVWTRFRFEGHGITTTTTSSTVLWQWIVGGSAVTTGYLSSTNAGNGTSAGTQSNTSGIQVDQQTSASSTLPLEFTLVIKNPGVTAACKTAKGDFSGGNATPSMVTGTIAGCIQASTGPLQGFQMTAGGSATGFSAGQVDVFASTN